MELTQQLYCLDENMTVYAKKPWYCDTEVELHIEPEDGRAPENLSIGYDYFIEVFIAKEVIPDLKHVDPSFTLEQWCERLIDYAENDA